jgi:molybdopterin synthase sulfur carrier subunit
MTDADLIHQPVDPVVRVRFWAGARAAAGVEQVSVPVGRVADVLAAAVRLAPGVAAILPLCSLLVDGRRVGPDEDTLPDSVVEVLPPFAGG